MSYWNYTNYNLLIYAQVYVKYRFVLISFEHLGTVKKKKHKLWIGYVFGCVKKPVFFIIIILDNYFKFILHNISYHYAIIKYDKCTYCETSAKDKIQ